MPVLLRDALRVKLYPIDRIALVLEAHNHAISGFRGDLQWLRQRGPLDNERMVASCREVLWQAGKHAPANMVHVGKLAMHPRMSPHHRAAIDLTDGLVPEADPENRHRRGRALDQ